MTSGLAAFIDRRPEPISTEERQRQVAVKPGLLAYLADTKPVSLLTVPIVYSVVLPFALLDLSATACQWICFPLLGIPRVKRRDYFVIDRHRLDYLNVIEKVHCLYCSYANGLVAYVREIAARTEQYACPIKHGRPLPSPHDRYRLFVEYGDADGYRRDLDRLRQSLDDRAEAPQRHD